jgi:hypothetical protein
VNVVTCQDGAVQFSDKIQDFPTDFRQTQSSGIMCYLPPVMYGVLDNSGNHRLNGQQFKDTLDRCNHFNTKIWPLGPKQLFILPKCCLSLFEDKNFGVNSNKTLVGLLTVHLDVRNKFSFMNVLVQLLYSRGS